MTRTAKPTPQAMRGSISIFHVQERIAAIDTEIQALEEEMKRHASLKDLVQWTMANEKKKKILVEREYLQDQKKAYHKAQDKEANDEEIQSRQNRFSSMKKLLAENYKLRKELQTIINSLIKKFQAIEALHVERVEQIPSTSEQERLAFVQDTYFHDFFMCLSSHPEALRFLQVAKKMEYRPMPKIRKMKDYQYVQTTN